MYMLASSQMVSLMTSYERFLSFAGPMNKWNRIMDPMTEKPKVCCLNKSYFTDYIYYFLVHCASWLVCN